MRLLNLTLHAAVLPALLLLLPGQAGADSREFELQGRLRRNVEFWVKIYTEYSITQGVVHDAKYVDKVYDVIELGRGSSGRSRSSRRAREHWRKVLLEAHEKRFEPHRLSEDGKKVFALYADIDEPDKFLNAAHRKRLRVQVGHRDGFLDGLRMSGEYLPHMERIFRKAGLPVELTRIPFVESSFNVHARSKVGASGVWQFIRSTGKLFLRIDDDVDERNDPIRATEAAAALLKANYGALGKWPLAVTAYNHGRMGMMRAVRLVGTDDFERIVDEYRGRTFGFSSSNYFACLVAAIIVERDAEKYFGKIRRSPPARFIEFQMPHAMRLKDLARFMKLDLKKLRNLNPALTTAVLASRRDVPAGYHLRVPHRGRLSAPAELRVFQAGYRKIPAMYKRGASRSKKYGKPVRRMSQSD